MISSWHCRFILLGDERSKIHCHYRIIRQGVCTEWNSTGCAAGTPTFSTMATALCPTNAQMIFLAFLATSLLSSQHARPPQQASAIVRRAMLTGSPLHLQPPVGNDSTSLHRRQQGLVPCTVQPVLRSAASLPAAVACWYLGRK